MNVQILISTLLFSMNFTTSPMSAVSTAAAATAIRRSRNVVNVSGGGKEGEGKQMNDVFIHYSVQIILTDKLFM